MTVHEPGILLTGGTGRLGRELTSCLPAIQAPPRAQLDVTLPDTIDRTLDAMRPDVIVHAAAWTDVAGAERHRRDCWAVNVEGTRNIVRAARDRGIFLVHMSTDYVFDGTRGGYAEDDVPGPARNYYALTKLVAEEVVRTTAAHLIIRTSFRAREWPHPSAFTDMVTSQDYVDVIAPMTALAIRHCRGIPHQVLHIATEPKTMYELARRRRPDVMPASKHDAGVELPDDCSLDLTRWQQVEARLLSAEA